ncbi:MAG: SDR family oxidoreductase [Cohaesibacteraceae bacterium]
MATIFITGASRGIGRELATRYLERGDTVYAAARSIEDLAPLKDQFGDRCIPISLDVTDGAAVDGLALVVTGSLDLLINNAGVIGPETPDALSMDYPAFARTLSVNTIAPLRVVHALLPRLREAEAAKIVTISSQMGMMAYAKSDRIAYRASKAAVNKVMQALATDLQPEDIAVMMVHPGWVRTDMGGQNADISVEESASGLMQVFDGLSLETTGSFKAWNGQTVPW